MRRAPVVFLALAVPIAAAGAIWIERVPIANWVLARVLDDRGFGPARPGIEAIGLHSATLRGASLCGGALKAQDVAAQYDLRELVSSHLSIVAIDGLQAALTMDGGEARLGSCVPTGVRSGSQSGLGVDTLILSNAHITLSGMGGAAEAMLSATFAIAGGKMEGRDVQAQISMPLGADSHARLEIRRFAADLDPRRGVRIAFDDASLALAHLPIEARGITGEFAWSTGRASAKLSVDRLVDRQTPIGLMPVALDAEARLAGPRLDFALHAAAGPGKAATLEAKGVFNRNDGRGDATIILGPIALGDGGPQPTDLVPSLRDTVAAIKGTVSAKGSLRFSAGGLTPDLLVRLKDVGFEVAGARVSDLSGAIRVTRLWPPATAPHQKITATVAAAGLPPAKLRVEGQLTAKPTLKIDTASLEAAGGSITAEPFSVDAAAPRIDTALDLADVDLAEITSLLDVAGLSGSGQLSGRVPLTIDQGKVTIGRGRLATEGPGVLRYDPKSPPKELAAAGQSVTLALRVLRDFHYDKLTLDLEKTAEGRGTVLLHLDGRNPAVMNGQAFRFNIRVESNFDRLAEIALLNLHSVQDFLRQATQRSER